MGLVHVQARVPLVRARRLVAILVGAFFSFYQDQVGAIFGLLWLLVQLAVIRSMIAAQLASSETRPQTTSDGGDHGTHQV